MEVLFWPKYNGIAIFFTKNLHLQLISIAHVLEEYLTRIKRKKRKKRKEKRKIKK